MLKRRLMSIIAISNNSEYNNKLTRRALLLDYLTYISDNLKSNNDVRFRIKNKELFDTKYSNSDLLRNVKKRLK